MEITIRGNVKWWNRFLVSEYIMFHFGLRIKGDLSIRWRRDIHWPSICIFSLGRRKKPDLDTMHFLKDFQGENDFKDMEDMPMYAVFLGFGRPGYARFFWKWWNFSNNYNFYFYGGTDLHCNAFGLFSKQLRRGMSPWKYCLSWAIGPC